MTYGESIACNSTPSHAIRLLRFHFVAVVLIRCSLYNPMIHRMWIVLQLLTIHECAQFPVSTGVWTRWMGARLRFGGTGFQSPYLTAAVDIPPQCADVLWVDNKRFHQPYTAVELHSRSWPVAVYTSVLDWWTSVAYCLIHVALCRVTTIQSWYPTFSSILSVYLRSIDPYSDSDKKRNAVISHCSTLICSHNYVRKAIFFETVSGAQLYLVKNSFLAYHELRTILMQEHIFPDFSLTTLNPLTPTVAIWVQL